MLLDDTNTDKTIVQYSTYKRIGINLIYISKNEVSPASVVQT